VEGMGLRDLLYKGIKSGFIGWLLHRLTAILLIILAAGHIFLFNYSTYLTGTPLIEGASAFIYYELLLISGAYHAVYGLKAILEELVLKKRGSLNFIVLMTLLWIIIVYIGSWMIWKIFVG
jgi:succinate dehydrogenase hydrophobic anchor subunit